MLWGRRENTDGLLRFGSEVLAPQRSKSFLVTFFKKVTSYFPLDSVRGVCYVPIIRFHSNKEGLMKIYSRGPIGMTIAGVMLAV